MSAEATVVQGVLLVDDTGCAKQGKAAVRVARQYAGTLGKVGHCQGAVTCCDNAIVTQNGIAHATLFPPRPDRWRRALPAVHREVARWLRNQAVI